MLLTALFTLPCLAAPTHEGEPGLTYVLTWDDALDGAFSAAKSTPLRLEWIDDRVAGRFAGPVFGHPRRAFFTGEVIRGADSAVLLLRQHEEGYDCLYQFQGAGGRTWEGVWHDTQGRRGDVRLEPAPAAVSPRPDAVGPVLQGRILDREGRPVPGVRLRCWRRAGEPSEIRTGPDGRFRFTGVLNTPQSVRSPRTGRKHPVRVEPGRDSEVVVLVRAPLLRGAPR